MEANSLPQVISSKSKRTSADSTWVASPPGSSMSRVPAEDTQSRGWRAQTRACDSSDKAQGTKVM